MQHAIQDSTVVPCRALATGLRSFANAPEWESSIRTLLLHGVDLHAPLSGTGNAHWDHHKKLYPWELSLDGELLDELFANTETPFDAKIMDDK